MVSNHEQRRLRHCERQCSRCFKSGVEAKQSEGSIFSQIASPFKLLLFKHSAMARNDGVRAALNNTPPFNALIVSNPINFITWAVNLFK